MVAAIVIIIACVIFLNTDYTLNKGENDITYNGVVYERANLNYNTCVSEEHAKKIGTYGQIYEYGREVIFDVYCLNDEANVLYTPHATFIKQGYLSPSPYGEDFASAEYVVSNGIDFLGMPDDYTEEATLLANFDKSVKLEDIIESEPSDITISDAELEKCNEIRFKYKKHADLSLIFYIYGLDGQYYLDVRQVDGAHEWFMIKPEYVVLLTSAIVK